MLYQSTGIVRYLTNPYKVIIEVDQDLADYYKSLVPKTAKLTGQRHAAHISVVRKQYPSDMTNWGLYEGEVVDFFYSNEVAWCSTYYWINTLCSPAQKIRESLGLTLYLSDEAHPPFKQLFHITIGNLKG